MVGGNQSLAFKPEQTTDTSNNQTVTHYVPQLGAGGYRLEQGTTHWIVTTPQANKLYFPHVGTSTEPVGYLTKVEYADGSYIKIEFDTGSAFYNIRSVKAYLKDGSVLSNALYFGYVTISGVWFLEKVVVGKSQPQTCTTNADCANDGGTCVTYNGSNGVCGYRRVEFLYTSSSFANATNTLAHSLYKAHHNPSTYTKDYIVYTYNTEAQMISAKDALGRILETHTYDDEGRAITSDGPSGAISISYNTGTNQATVTGPTNSGYLRNITYDPYTSNISSQSGTCGCSTYSSQQNWLRQHGYILPLYNQLQGEPNSSITPYRTHAYNFEKRNPSYSDSAMRLAWDIVTHGDTNNDGSDSPPMGSFQVKTYYHKDFPGLAVATETPSFNTGKKSLIIFDYDASPQTGSNQCSTTTMDQCLSASCSTNDPTCILVKFNTNPTSQVHRVIVRGYTKTISGGTWEIKTRVYEYQYDTQGRLTSILGPQANQETKLTYYTGNPANPLNAHRLKTVESKVESPLNPGTFYWLITQFTEYNIFGQVISVRDPNNIDTITSYDFSGRVVSQYTTVTNPTTSISVSYKYDDSGMLSEMKQPNGNIYIYQYNNYRRVEQISYKENDTVSTDQILKKYYYDGLQRLTKVEDLVVRDQQSQIRATNYSYNYITSSGNIYENGHSVTISLPVPASGTSTDTYDAHQRLRESIANNQQKVVYNYDPQRLWLTRVDQYKDLGTTSPFSLYYTRYDDGQIKTIQDGQGVTTLYDRDDFGQLLMITSPDRGPSGIQYEYDLSGNVSKVKRADGIIVTMQYDTLNRLVKIDYPDPNQTGLLTAVLADNDVEFRYDEPHGVNGMGRLTSVMTRLLKDSGEPSGYWLLGRHYKYDEAGRMVEEQIYDGATIVPTWIIPYKYNVMSQLTQITYPHSSWLTYNYEYDGKGQFINLNQDYSPNPSIYRIKMQHYSPYASALSLPHQLIHDSSSNSSPTQNSSTATYTTSFYQQNLFANIHPSGSTGTVIASGNNVLSTLQGHVGLIHRLYEYDSNGMITGFACNKNSEQLDHCYPGNKAQSYKYNGVYQLTEGGELLNPTSTIPRFEYTYDFNANLTKTKDRFSGGKTWILNYIAGTNRIEKRYEEGYQSTTTQNYSHDPAGRRNEDHYWEYIYHSNGRLALMSLRSEVS